MLTLIKRQFTCLDCKKEDKHLATIKDTRDILPNFSIEHVEDPDSITRASLYEYNVVRVDGIISHREATKIKCPSCGSKNLEAKQEDNYQNVLNFYSPSLHEKWYVGFNK